MPTKAKLSTVRAGLAKLRVDARPAVSAWLVALWNLEATVAAVGERLRELGTGRPMTHPALIVMTREADRLGVAGEPDVIEAARGLKRALSMQRAAGEYVMAYEDRRTAERAVEDAANAALGIVLDQWCPWPGKLPPAPPITARPAPVLPSWVGTLTEAELRSFDCSMTAAELTEWVAELHLGGEGST